MSILKLGHNFPLEAWKHDFFSLPWWYRLVQSLFFGIAFTQRKLWGIKCKRFPAHLTPSNSLECFLFREYHIELDNVWGLERAGKVTYLSHLSEGYIEYLIISSDNCSNRHFKKNIVNCMFVFLKSRFYPCKSSYCRISLF